MASQSRFMSVGDAARELGLSLTRTYQLAREGSIPAIRRGRAVVIPVAAWERWLEARAAEALASTDK